MPGLIVTNIQRHMSLEEKQLFGLADADGRPVTNSRMKSVEQGAATTVWACVAPELEGRGGLYLEDCQISPEKSVDALKQEFTSGQTMPVGVCPHALDEKKASKLWDFSLEAIKQN